MEHEQSATEDILTQLALEIMEDPNASRREKLLVMLFMRQDRTLSLVTNLTNRILALESYLAIQK